MAVIDHEPRLIGARLVRREAGRQRRRRIEDRVTACRSRHHGPQVREGITVDVGRMRRVEVHDGTRGDELVASRIADRPRIRVADGDCRRRTVALAIIDDELHGVSTGDIDNETRVDRRGIRENRSTAVRESAQAPAISQCVAVDIGRSGTVERHRCADRYGLVGTRVGHRGMIEGRRNAVDALSKRERRSLRIAELQDDGRQRSAGAQAAPDQREVEIGLTGGCRAGSVGEVNGRVGDAGHHE